MDPILLLFIGLAVIIGGILWLKLHPVLALLFSAIVVGVLTTGENLAEYARAAGLSAAETDSLMAQSVGRRIASAFGNTASKIGILIAMAAIIGTTLLRSGAADQIIRRALRVTGEKRAPVAFMASGFTLGIPVFFDTVFYLMIPLAKAMNLRTKKNYLFYLTVIIAGASMAHSLVPPTPGPLFVAAEMGVDLGVMMIGGLIIGVFTIIGGYTYAAWANRRWTIPLRDTGDISVAEMEELMDKDEKQLPALWLSLLPILLPLVLISMNTISKATMDDGLLLEIFSFIGDPNIALTLAAIVGLITLVMYIPERKQMKGYVMESLQSGGMIILITSMGGALGGILQQTGIAGRIQEMAGNYQMAILPLAFVVTSVMRTAQGSATVAMITAVGILSGVANVAELAFHPVYIALIIGCGSKPFPWMNDSGFWVVCKMSGMTEGETLKTHSTVLTIMGIVGFIVILIFAKLFPLI